MSIPPEQAKSAIGGLATGSAAGVLGGQNANAGQAAQAQMVQPQLIAHTMLMQLIDSRVAAVIAATKATESKVVTFAKRYWPVAAGLAVAATRLIH